MSRNLLLLLLATAAPLVAQTPEQQVKDLEREISKLDDQLIDERVKLLRDVRVNGEQLDPRQVMREAIYLTGGKLVEGKVSSFFLVEELKRQVDSGKHNADEFLVTDEEVMEQLAPLREKFATEHPGVDFWEVVRTQYGLNRETFVEQRREAILFDRVFFPGAPKDWPDITKEAIKTQTTNEQGPRFLEQLEKVTEGTDEQGKPRKLPEFWLQMMRQFVQKGLRNWSDIRYASDGLPPEVVLQVNDLQWPTEEAFEFVKKGLYVQDLERALQEVAAREALRQELVAKGAYLSDEEFKRRYDEYREPYDSTPFTVEIVATKFKGFPCLEAFRARWRLLASYGEMIADELTDENLIAHSEKFAAFFGDGQVNCDVIPFMGRDTITGAWQPDGLDAARERCDVVLAALEKREMTFDEALKKHGEFFPNDEKRGRLGLLPLNQVKRYLRESEFTQLMDGYSLASYLFWEAPVGKAVGPLPGPDCWFIARVNQRTPAKKRINIENENERKLVREDYITRHFFDWANEVIGRTKFE
jgi:hypothetical protein